MAIDAGTVLMPVEPDTRGFGRLLSRRIEADTTGRAKGVGSKIGGALFRGLAAAFAVDRVVRLIGSTIEAASDLQESITAVDAVFGKAAAGVQKWSTESAQGIGLARSEALEGARAFGAMLVPMEGISRREGAEMSTRLVELAGDMASFNNESPVDMLERLRAGLAGEAEPLRRFGVRLSAARIEQEALNLGLIEADEELTDADKAMAAYSIILADTKLQQGDFARTSDGLANQQRILNAQWTDAKAALGKELLPAAEATVKFLNEYGIPAFGTLATKVGKAITAFGNFADDVLGVVGQVTDDETGVPKISNAVSDYLGVEVPDTLNASGSDFKRWADKVDDAAKDAINSWGDLTGTVTNDTLTFGEKFGIIWADLWDETAEEKARKERLMLQDNSTWAGRMIGNIADFLTDVKGEFVEGYREWRNRDSNFQNERSREWREFWRDIFGTQIKWFNDLGTNTKVQWFVLGLMWDNGLRKIRTNVTTWGRDLVTFWRELPGRIAGAFSLTAIKDKIASIAKGFTIPIKLAFGLGDGLGFGAIGPGGGAGLAGLTGPLQAAAGVVQRLGGFITSGFRSGSITSTGNLSYHARGRAIDVGPPSMGLFNAMRSIFPNATELIYTPAGNRQLWHGQNHVYTGGSIQRDHYDHIHLALEAGGLINRSGRFLVGEGTQGEIVNLNRGDMVTPLDQLRAPDGGGGFPDRVLAEFATGDGNTLTGWIDLRESRARRVSQQRHRAGWGA